MGREGLGAHRSRRACGRGEASRLGIGALFGRAVGVD